MFQGFAESQRDEAIEVKEYEAPGCPEEPDAPVKIVVYTPVALKGKKKKPILFITLGGGMLVVRPEMFPIGDYCKKYNCVCVVPIYRTMFQAKYPGAINDLHAAYQWMVENAETLGVDKDKVVIHGISSGGHLATCIPFRLMRYGFSPRGIVAVSPITDDRSMYDSARLALRGYWDDWDGASLRKMAATWMGDNFASPLVGPDAFANHATIEECVGYPPLFIHTGEFEPDRDNNKEFIAKILAAKSFAEYHIWGGGQHALTGWADPSPLIDRITTIIEGNIKDCWKYDLRRPWVYEDEK